MSLTKEMIAVERPISSEDIITFLQNNSAKGFNIPTYQRLYAWSEKEITILLNDFYNAFTINPDKEYFIGNLTLNYNRDSSYYDIIDGQQRMTTLWLIGLRLSLKNAEWNSFLKNDHDILLRFTSREDDHVYLKALVDEGNSQHIENVNPMMLNAIKCIDVFLADKKVTKVTNELSEYIFRKVKMAVVLLPEDFDLNKYFENMNNRGLQLEPHHILKATFIEKLDRSVSSAYAKVWDAVSQMNQYVEYNFDGVLKSNRERLFKGNVGDYFIRDDKSNENSPKEKSLRDLISMALQGEDIKTNKKESDFQDKVVSIVSFPEFLLYCLAIFIEEHALSTDKFSYDDKKMNGTFNAVAGIYDCADKFITFLFKMRIRLDECFIKSVVTPEGTRWKIKKIVKNEDGDYIRKSYLDNEIVQLQSMLNVSTSLTLWFKDALAYAKLSEFSGEGFISKLKELDRRNNPVLPAFSELNKGTSTHRYWFFKLDYLLWKKWSKQLPDVKIIDGLESKIKNFQFRDNRSIEHIQPRNPDGIDWVVSESDSLDDIKNMFGNLALISVSANSGYNHQLPKSKRQDFIKRTERWGIESLKLLDAYSYAEWSIENMNRHQHKMWKVLEEEYS